MPDRLQIQSSPGWPQVSWWLTEDGGERLCAAVDFLARLVRGQQPEGAMPIGMIANLMSGFDDSADDCGALLGLLADDEKRGSCVKLCEDVEDARRKHRVRTIVKRERHGTLIPRATSHRSLTHAG
jgi:hypothetical protein